MAPLPFNNTAILFVDYSVGGEAHTLQLRYQDGNTATEAMETVDAFLTALDDSIRTITITGARNRAINADFSFPVTWSGAATYGTGTATHSQSAWYLDFVARSSGGRRVRIAVFGATEVEDLAESDYRLPASGNILDALLVLNGATDVICAIDGEAVVFNPYANTGMNAYWRNRIR